MTLYPRRIDGRPASISVTHLTWDSKPGYAVWVCSSVLQEFFEITPNPSGFGMHFTGLCNNIKCTGMVATPSDLKNPRFLSQPVVGKRFLYFFVSDALHPSPSCCDGHPGWIGGKGFDGKPAKH